MSAGVLGLDQGTTSTRILSLIDGEAPRIVHALGHTTHYPADGWCEQDPEELVRNLEACLSAAGPAAALGLANQGESCLAWDAETKRPLSPVITWQDSRTSPLIERLRSDGSDAEILSRTGLPLDSYFSASKLGWIMANLPEARAAHRGGRLRLGTTDAFFLDRLAGAFATDPSTASRTSLMNIATGEWDGALCELFGVPIECLPEIRPTMGEFGSVGGVPVCASVVDQQAALWGHGCRSPGDIKITFGTGAIALAIAGEGAILAPGSALLPTIAWSGPGGTIRAVEGGVYDAGTAVEWAQRIGIIADITELDAFGPSPAIERGLAFVPALSGLACPYWDRSATGLWIGMSAATTRRDLAQALIEGIAFRAAEVIGAIACHMAVSTPISIDGGLSRSGYFCQFLADVLGLQVGLPTFDELTALGCAQMARATLAGSDDPVRPQATLINPRAVDRDGWCARHRKAVERARGWR